MTIHGLENNYYLAQNDIWIHIFGFDSQVAVLKLHARNAELNIDIPELKLYPSPNNDFRFNISAVVRALFPDPDHIDVKNMFTFQFSIDASFIDSNIPNETFSISKYFIRGGREQNVNAEWFMENGEYLIVGKWITYTNYALPTGAIYISNNTLAYGMPINYTSLTLRCPEDVKLVKFRNSLGGYQYYAFEKFQFKTKAKSDKTISRIAKKLREDNFKNEGISTVRTLELWTKTPYDVQEVITDLITSPEIFIYHPDGNNENAKWQRLKIESNDAIENNFDRAYDNKIEFSFPNHRTIE